MRAPLAPVPRIARRSSNGRCARGAWRILLALLLGCGSPAREPESSPVPGAVVALDTLVEAVHPWAEVPHVVAMLSRELAWHLDSADQARLVGRIQAVRAEGDVFAPRPVTRSIPLDGARSPDLAMEVTSRERLVSSEVELRFTSARPGLLTRARHAVRLARLAALDTLGAVRVDVGTSFAIDGAPMGVSLTLTTVREYGCLGYAVMGEWTRRGDTLALILDGVLPPRGVCPTAMGPATRTWPLTVERGRHPVLITYRAARVLLELDRSDSLVQLRARSADPIVAAVDERAHWLLTEGGFVLACGPARSPARLCEALHDWVAGVPGVARRAPVGAVTYPAWPREFNDAANVTAAYRVSDDDVMRVVMDCLASLRRFFADTRGTTLRVQTWRGEEVAASRAGQWGRVLDPPSVLGHTSACGGVQ